MVDYEIHIKTPIEACPTYKISTHTMMVQNSLYDVIFNGKPWEYPVTYVGRCEFDPVKIKIKNEANIEAWLDPGLNRMMGSWLCSGEDTPALKVNLVITDLRGDRYKLLNAYPIEYNYNDTSKEATFIFDCMEPYICEDVGSYSI